MASHSIGECKARHISALVFRPFVYVASGKDIGRLGTVFYSIQFDEIRSNNVLFLSTHTHHLPHLPTKMPFGQNDNQYNHVKLDKIVILSKSTISSP